eukprot:TRINITY_DN5188_c0_g1_i1.p2 TRINITY_DN5188_c0_g1~~TRINITY_DN5188_c0_g1_i1.p2  ORF type:complete len:123 (+),score=45.71 TRINITY_DN5188_c0_g1_i1:105-473(+)
MIVYDVGNDQSFENVNMWLSEIEHYTSTQESANMVKFLVGNKNDIPSSKKMVPSDTAQQFADSRGMKFFETSAKTAANVEQAFVRLVYQVREKMSQNQLKSVDKKAPVSLTATTERENGCCS